MRYIYYFSLAVTFIFSIPVYAQTGKVDIFELSFEDLANIKVISATQQEQTIGEAPAIISIITRQQIRERGYQTVGEALKSIAGLDPLHDRFQYNLGLRGINGGMRAWSRIVKVMIDGQPVAFRSSSENFLGKELIPMNVIERIEIVRGPGSALYGSNALLGVINIITRRSELSKWAEVSGQIGSSQFINGDGSSFALGGKSGGLNYMVAGTFNKSDLSGQVPVNVPGSDIYGSNDKSKNDISRNRSLFGRIEYENETIGKIGLNFNYQSMDSFGEFQDWGVLTHNNRINIGNFYIQTNYSRKVTDKLTGNFSLAYSEGKPFDNDRLDIDSDPTDWITREVGYKGFDVSADLIYNISANNTVTVGFDHTTDDQDLQTYYLNVLGSPKSPRQGIINGSKDFINTGYFLQAIYYPVPDLGITAGLRYDDHNIYEDVVNYRLAGVYQVYENFYAKLLFGTSYKAPSSVQLFSNFIVSRGVVGNPDLNPEKASTFEAGVGLQPVKNFSINVNAFYNTISDKVELVIPEGSLFNVRPDNIAKINSAGLEIEVLHNFRNLRSFVNYSFQKSIIEKDHLIRGKIKLNTDIYPSNMVKFGANYRLTDYFLNLNLEGRWIDSRRSSEVNSFIFDPVNFRINRYKLDSYLVIDVTIATQNINLLPGRETGATIKIYNIFDTKFAYPGFKDFDIPGFRRSIVFNLTQYF